MAGPVGFIDRYPDVRLDQKKYVLGGRVAERVGIL
jgi:hypothetical protein